MSKHLELAQSYRNDTNIHYNCAQSVLMAFKDVTGLSDEASFKVAADFGGGLKHGNTCGAITGGLMVLGFLGYEDHETVAKLFDLVANEHDGCTDCADLIRINSEKGLPKKPHCDKLVYDVVEFIDKLIEAKA